jgi:hypothetical protein
MRFRSPKSRKASVLGALLGQADQLTEADERVAFYCSKLRNFLMPVHPWENLRFRNAALRIQRRFRERRAKRGQKPPRLATTMYLLESGGKDLPQDPFQKTMILQVSSLPTVALSVDAPSLAPSMMPTGFEKGWSSWGRIHGQGNEKGGLRNVVFGALQMESIQRDQKKLMSLVANQEKIIAELRMRAVGGI